MIKECCVSIDNLPGIKTVEASQLSELGIKTNLDLLLQGNSDNQKQQLARTMDTNIRQIAKWFALADLSRIQSVGAQYCGLILHSGISSVRQLSETTPPRLHRQILRLQVATLQRKDLCPPVSLVQRWIREAQLISPIV